MKTRISVIHEVLLVVTLVRKALCAPLEDSMTPIAWRVNEFALIHSQLNQGGSRYRLLGNWPLE